MGRTVELGALSAAIEAAQEGVGSAVLVAGEAGIGKTRLVREAANCAATAGAQVLWASGWEPGGAPGHWHWVQVLRSLASDQDRQSLVQELGPDAAEVSRLVPDLRPGVALAPPGAPEGDNARFRMYDAVASYLRRASARRPLVIVLDDLHTADLGTITLLRFVATEVARSRMAVISTAREPLSESGSPDVAAAVADLRRDLPTVAVPSLERTDVESMLEDLVGPEESTRLAADIHRRAAGNPLFVRELALLLRGRPAGGDGGRLPVSIRAVLERRLAVVPARALELLRAAAVVGDEFEVGLVATTASANRTEVLDAIDHAIRASLVIDRRPSDPEWAFSHGLVRELLYEQLPLSRRAVLHREIGNALEAASGTDPALPQLARHFLAGAAAVADGKGPRYAERAGQMASDQLAYEDAAGYFRAALEAPDADRARTIPLLLALGEATLRSGDLAAARDAFVHAAGLARQDGRYDLLAEAALGLGSGLDGFEIRLFDHAQITLLEEALDHLGSRPSALRAWVTARLSVALTFAESQERRLQLATDAVEMARQLDEPRALAYALAARCDATAGPDHIDGRRAAADEMIRLARRAGDRGMELLGRRNRVIALLEGGDIAGVDAEIESYEMVAGAIGQPLYQWYVPLWRGMRALMDGRLEASRAQGQLAAAVGARARSRNADLNVEVLEWNTLLAEGRFREAGDVLRGQLELADGIYGEPFWVPLIAAPADPAGARAALDRLAAKDFDELPRDAIWLAAMTYVADACGVLGRRPVAEKAYEHMLPYASRFAVDAIGAACYGSMSRPLGVLATVLGRLADAEAHFEEALTAHRACGATALVAQTLLDHGRACVTFGDVTRGNALLAEARALYRSLAMNLRAGLTEGAAARSGGDVYTSESNVFRREGSYWTLSYAGRTARVPDAKGLRDIAMLLARPGRELHVADLISAADPTDPSDEQRRAALLRGSQARIPLLDDQARSAYQARLIDLRDDLEEAEANADLGRAEAARAEMDLIAHELATALGLGRRTRVQADASERARKAVTQRIRNTVKRLETVHPELANHLERAVRTGRFCSYSPENPIQWSL